MDTMYRILEEMHYELGFWDKDSPNEPYRYVLSPDAMRLDDNYQQQLQTIAAGVSACLKSLPMLQKLSENPNGDHSLGLASTLIRQGNNGFTPNYSDTRAMPMCKVDIMIDSNNTLQIAELDAYNPRGIAYIIMLRHIYQQCIDEQSQDFIGMAEHLKNVLPQDEMSWIYADRERYYGRVINISNNLLYDKTGIRMHGIQSSKTNGEVYLPKMILPFGMSNKDELSLRDTMMEQYLSNPKEFFFPAMPWVGSKGLLGLVSNPTSNSILNPLSESFEKDTFLLKNHLPETVLVGRKFQRDVLEFQNTHEEYVLKMNMASGMKGVWMPGNTNFENELTIAQQAKKASYVLQQFVDQKKHEFSYFDVQGELQVRDDWYVRLIAYISSDGQIIDAEVTARTEPDVHGALDCLQIPCILSK
jgi:hypothetical protein